MLTRVKAKDAGVQPEAMPGVKLDESGGIKMEALAVKSEAAVEIWVRFQQVSRL